MTDHNELKSSMAENFIRSAKAPAIKAGVMMAKVSWKQMKTVSGIVPVIESLPTPLRNAFEKPPTNDFMFIPSAAFIPVVSNAML